MIVEKWDADIVALAWIVGFGSEGHVIFTKLPQKEIFIDLWYLMPESKMAFLRGEVGRNYSAIVI